MDILIRKKTIGGIPLLELYEPGTLKRPLVIICHGYTGFKELMVTQGYALAAQGYYVVIPDAPTHGERFTGQVGDLMDVVNEMAGEIDGFIGHYREEPAADAGRAGLAGYSMGGCVVYEYIARPGSRIKAAVPVIATPDWASLMGSPYMDDLMENVGFKGASKRMQEYIDRGAALQPMNRIGTMASTPLLMLNGADDFRMPAAAIEAFYEKIKPLYHNADDVRLIVYPEVGHDGTVEMNREMAEWFKKYL